MPSSHGSLSSLDADSSTFTPHSSVPDIGGVQKLSSRQRRMYNILKKQDQSRIASLGRVDDVDIQYDVGLAVCPRGV